MKFEPMPHQTKAIQFLLTHDHGALFLGMGLGKTVTSLYVLKKLICEEFYLNKVLVIAPKNVAENVWAQEIEKWDELEGLTCSIVSGTAKQRLTALRTNAHLYIIGRDNVVWLADTLGKTWPFQGIVIDELSSFKNAGSKRWKALKKLAPGCRVVWGLTGTPAPNGYLDLWPQMFLLDGGQRLGKRIGEYRERYFSPGAHKGHVVYEWRLRMGAKETIDRKLRDLCLSMSSEDWLHLPPTLYNEIPVSMDEKARATYDKLKKDKVIPLLRKGTKVEQLDPNDPEQLERMTSAVRGDTAAAIAGKLLQMANGAVYDDDRGVVELHDGKLEALAEIAELNRGENLLVFYSYQHDRDRILQRFPTAQQFDGPESTATWNAGKVPMLLCHPASCGHGLNLQGGGHIIVWFGLPWSLELYQQANARLPRPGQKESVIIHHIICRDTLDEAVMASLREKNKTQDGLLRALKGYLNKEEWNHE